MPCSFAKSALAARKLIDMAYISIKLVPLLPPSSRFDEIGKAQTTKVFWKCLNNLSIEADLTIKGDIFNHPGCDSFLGGKDRHLLEIARKNGGRPCAFHGIQHRPKIQKKIATQKNLAIKKKQFFRGNRGQKEKVHLEIPDFENGWVETQGV